MKLLIRQGRLVDPVGGIGGVMDILLEDGKVAVIGSDIREFGRGDHRRQGPDGMRRPGGYARAPAGARL